MSQAYRAYLKKVKVSPRKARLVVDLVRGRNVQEALDILKLTTKKTAPVVSKLIRSAIAGAHERATVDTDSLFISKAVVDEGPTLKRFLPRAQGRATPIRKRTSHITLEIKEF